MTHPARSRIFALLCLVWVHLMVCGVAHGHVVYPGGESFSSPRSIISDAPFNASLVYPLRRVTSNALCAGPVSLLSDLPSSSPNRDVDFLQAVLYVSHTAGDILQCQFWTLCENAIASGAAAVIDAPIEPTPIGSLAARSWLYPKASRCAIPYFLVAFNVQDASFPLLPSEIRFNDYVDSLLANGTNVTVRLEVSGNQWFTDCREAGSFYLVWRWLFFSLTLVFLLVLAFRLGKFFFQRQFLTVPVLSCAFAFLAFSFQLIRLAGNPSNCYGYMPGWSSELDAFFFTIDIPAVIAALMILGTFQLEILQPKRMTSAKLDQFRIPVIVAIACLFALQLIVFSIVQTGSDPSNSSIVVQAVIYLLCFLALLAFYLYATFKLARAVMKKVGGTSNTKRLQGPLTLAAFAVAGCLFSFAAGGLVLANSTYTETNFIVFELLSDCSTLFSCAGIAFVVGAKDKPSVDPESASRVRSSSIARLKSAVMHKLKRESDDSSSEQLAHGSITMDPYTIDHAKQESFAEPSFASGAMEL